MLRMKSNSVARSCPRELLHMFFADTAVCNTKLLRHRAKLVNMSSVTWQLISTRRLHRTISPTVLECVICAGEIALRRLHLRFEIVQEPRSWYKTSRTTGKCMYGKLLTAAGLATLRAECWCRHWPSQLQNCPCDPTSDFRSRGGATRQLEHRHMKASPQRSCHTLRAVLCRLRFRSRKRTKLRASSGQRPATSAARPGASRDHDSERPRRKNAGSCEVRSKLLPVPISWYCDDVTICAEGQHRCGTDGKQCAVVEWKVRHNLVTWATATRHTRGASPSPEHPSRRARCAVVAKYEETATEAAARRWRQRKAETAKEEHAEVLCLELAEQRSR